MGAVTGIKWTDSTLNCWVGCQKVGPGCDHCYAEAWDNRYGGGHWGPGAPRRRTTKNTWNQALKWNREAKAAGVRRRVFVNSLSDFWDNAVDPAWRADAFALFAQCDWLDFQLVTKRVGNIEKMMPGAWRGAWPVNIWQLISVVNQEEADRDIPKLIGLKRDHKIDVAGLSMEPLLGPVDLEYPESFFPDGPPMCCSGRDCGCLGLPIEPPMLYGLDWVIVGGESGGKARPMLPEWERAIRTACDRYGIAYFFKQWGEYGPYNRGLSDSRKMLTPAGDKPIERWGKKLAGDFADGQQHHNFPRAA